MTAARTDARRRYVDQTVEISSAGAALVALCLLELLFNRAFNALGVYHPVASEGPLRYLPLVGQLTMNATGVLSLLLACILLPRLSGNPRFSSLPARVLLMLASPLFLPVICVAVFRPISSALVLVSYLVATSTVLYLTALLVFNPIEGGKKRIIGALAIIQLLAAFELLASHQAEGIAHTAYIFTEALFIATPVFAFFVFLPGSLLEFVKRPHVLGLLFGLVVVGISGAVGYVASGKTLLTMVMVAFKSMGLTLSVPGGFPVYLVALFFGASLVGTLTLPSAKWPPTSDTKRAGVGLACIWTAGIQPTHPYQLMLMFVGFLYLACSLVPKRV